LALTQGHVCETSGFKPQGQRQGHTSLNPKDRADILQNYVNFSEEYDRLVKWLPECRDIIIVAGIYGVKDMRVKAQGQELDC